MEVEPLSEAQPPRISRQSCLTSKHKNAPKERLYTQFLHNRLTYFF